MFFCFLHSSFFLLPVYFSYKFILWFQGHDYARIRKVLQVEAGRAEKLEKGM
jgi:hypothetical protein